ncbi:ABC transporter permease [Ruminococcus sp.]|uniref:ABC transporter permease n=1 Tax=Ruminococcus sp. TaxID=41978 RepID=UPI0025F0B67D|nr:ABC transporter permease [Ruminococcus sp.]MCI5815879.1 ABC transporter permease [Ruminococcus sp.]MDY4963388.1 ABC transporter permease [Ruminococcus callidus]
MTGLGNLIYRNCKLFFKDKAMFFTSLVTPMILLVLYATFLGKVYRDSFASALPESMEVSQKLINGTAGGELLSSLLAVSCVTVSVCCNALIVQDKVTGARRDLTMTPVRRSTLALSYYFATLISTAIICLLALGAGLLYLGKVGWYLSAGDIFLLVSDVLLLVLFGTALSSVLNFFLSSQGQISAVGTIISAGYGFICGAYMPISQFGSGLQKIISFLPGTYGTSLLRNHALRGVYEAMETEHFPPEAIESIKDSIDCNLYFFGTKVSTPAMYGILCGAIGVLIAVYVLLNLLHKSRK